MSRQSGCQCLGSLTCAQTLMRATAHGGCTDTVREAALKVDSGRKIPCRTGESNLRQRRAGLTLDQLSYIPAPLYLVERWTRNRKVASSNPGRRFPPPPNHPPPGVNFVC